MHGQQHIKIITHCSGFPSNFQFTILHYKTTTVRFRLTTEVKWAYSRYTSGRCDTLMCHWLSAFTTNAKCSTASQPVCKWVYMMNSRTSDQNVMRGPHVTTIFRSFGPTVLALSCYLSYDS